MAFYTKGAGKGVITGMLIFLNENERVRKRCDTEIKDSSIDIENREKEEESIGN